MHIAKESGHWYAMDGSPMYTVDKADGSGLRNTTLRDARKMNLCPSVTTILKVAAQPGLERWKRNQTLLAALTLPQVKGENLDDFAKRVAIDADQHSRQAAERGTRIHGEIEKHFLGQPVLGEALPIVQGVEAAMSATFGDQAWSMEKSFACPLGYGGKVDLHSPEYVVDYKTKEFDEDKKLRDLVWPEMALQLDAYRHGLGYPKAQMANVIISVTVPGLVKIHIWPEGTYFEQFCCLLHYWQLSKRYKPTC